MARLTWDTPESLFYETGVDRGVFFPRQGPSVPWNGLISVEESPSGSDGEPRYLEGRKLRNPRKIGVYEGTITCYSYPEALDDHILSRRERRFDFSYRTMTNRGYRIHLIYNVLAVPTSLAYAQQDPSSFTWDISTVPLIGPEEKRMSHLIIDTEDANSQVIKDFEDAIYGSETQESSLPRPIDVISYFDRYDSLRIIDNGDGTWTAIGPDSAIRMLDDITFEITWPTAVYISPIEYTLQSS